MLKPVQPGPGDIGHRQLSEIALNSTRNSEGKENKSPVKRYHKNVATTTAPTTKKRKIEPRSKTDLPEKSKLEEALSMIKKNLKVEPDWGSEQESKRDNRAAFTELRVKPIKELQSDSEDEAEVKKPKSVLPTRVLDFGPGVYLPHNRSLIPHQNSNFSNHKQLCFHCKCYGHRRENCNNQWYHWWPREYLDKHPWLHTKIRKIRHLKNQSYGEFRQSHYILEDQAEDEEWNEMASRKRSGALHQAIKTYNDEPRYNTAFPKTHRRLPPVSQTCCSRSKDHPRSPKLKDEKKMSDGPSFDFGNPLDIFRRLQTQIEDLKNSLEQLKMQQTRKVY